MKQLKYAFYSAIALSCAVMVSCSYDIAEELRPACDDTDVTYTDTVLPIIEDNCYGCHSATEGQGGITLEPYSELEPYATDGTLICVINHEDDCQAMPQDAAKLSDCDILLIQTWIDNGALED